MNEQNSLETKLCKVCKKNKLLKSFHKTYGVPHARCKQCKLDGKKVTKAEVVKDRSNNYFRLTNTTKEDYIETYRLLEAMGYDLKKDIHVQFCEKYNLKPREPKKTHLPYYSQQDCFDF